MSFNHSIDWSLNQLIHPSNNQSIYQPIHPSIHQPIHTYIHPSIHHFQLCGFRSAITFGSRYAQRANRCSLLYNTLHPPNACGDITLAIQISVTIKAFHKAADALAHFVGPQHRTLLYYYTSRIPCTPKQALRLPYIYRTSTVPIHLTPSQQTPSISLPSRQHLQTYNDPTPPPSPTPLSPLCSASTVRPRSVICETVATGGCILGRQRGQPCRGRVP